jgi:hypothetical protein
LSRKLPDVKVVTSEKLSKLILTTTIPFTINFHNILLSILDIPQDVLFQTKTKATR